MKSWLQDNNIEVYSTHNEGKSVKQRFIKNLKNKYMILQIHDVIILVSKNVHITKLAHILTLKQKNDGDPKFEFGGHVRILKYKIIFLKSYTPNCFVFVIKEIRRYCVVKICY